MARIFVGNTPIFRFEIRDCDTKTAIDISGATTLEVLFKKPSGTCLTKTATETNDGTDGLMEYQALVADLDEAGDWLAQPRIVIPGFTGHGEISEFKVTAPLC